MQEIVLGTIHGMIASGDLQKHLSSPTTEVPQGNPDGSGQPQPAPPAGGPASLFEHRAALQSSKIAPA
jgi:hypothetical protein